LFIFGGIVGSGIAGTIVEIKKNYKVVINVLAILTATTPVPLLLSLRAMSVAGSSISCFIVGASSVSILPVGIDFAVEITHPVPESISSGLLTAFGQFMGIIYTVTVSLWITGSGNEGVIGG